MSKFKNRTSREQIIKRFFSNPEKTLHLNSGDVLLEQHAFNDKLFYVVKGKILAFLPDKKLHEPIFESYPDTFIGVYSYFSDDSRSYSKLVAEEESVVSYYNDDPFDLPVEERLEFMTYLFEVGVEELKRRQLFAGNMAHQRMETLQKLIHQEKMATLGQMAAGIAHELNNAIGSMSSNLRQFQSEITSYLLKNEDGRLMKFFEMGVEHGQEISSADARKARAGMEKLGFLDKGTIKILSRTGITRDEFEASIGKDVNRARKAAKFWEIGHLIHDMAVAAKQSSHVIQSMKSAGVAKQRWTKNADVNQTVAEALTIVKRLTKDIEVEVRKAEELPTTELCIGEIIQVWINLIQNAVESMVNSDTESPKLILETGVSDDQIKVSVTDNGPGIPKDLFEKIFQPNFTTKVGGLSFGLGLGLTIVQRMVDEHNGRIELSSKPGRTKFDIYLPIVN